jgi:DNA-binding NarL/FixJ family response regulator
VIRTGLRLLLSTEPDMEILGEAGGADEAMELMRRIRRRNQVVVLVGLGLDGEHDAYWLIRSIRTMFPTMAILASGMNADGMTVSRALFMGADGFIDKGTQSSEFVHSIREAAAGRVVLSGVPLDSFGEVVDGLQRHGLTEPVLTSRELEVISVAAQGLTAREIGNRLGVRERTVTTHLGRIYKKLGCRTRVSAVAVAQRSGLLTLTGSG